MQRCHLCPRWAAAGDLISENPTPRICSPGRDLRNRQLVLSPSCGAGGGPRLIRIPTSHKSRPFPSTRLASRPDPSLPPRMQPSRCMLTGPFAGFVKSFLSRACVLDALRSPPPGLSFQSYSPRIPCVEVDIEGTNREGEEETMRQPSPFRFATGPGCFAAEQVMVKVASTRTISFSKLQSEKSGSDCWSSI